MAREVDRLLAQLASTAPPTSPQSSYSRTSGPHRRVTRVSGSARAAASRRDLVGLWARVTLAAGLGALMLQWPYPRACGLPLAGYLGAVAVVMLAGVWIAVVSWKLRSAGAHALAFLLLFWALGLAAERALPRVGYAAERASWICAPDTPSRP